MDCSPPGSSVHGIFQARILEWVATPGDLPTSGCEPGSPTLKADSLLPEPPVKAPYKYLHLYKLVRLILLTTRRKIRGTERSVLALAEQHGNTGAILV